MAVSGENPLPGLSGPNPATLVVSLRIFWPGGVEVLAEAVFGPVDDFDSPFGIFSVYDVTLRGDGVTPDRLVERIVFLGPQVGDELLVVGVERSEDVENSADLVRGQRVNEVGAVWCLATDRRWRGL